jgi:hypothetical protein
VILKFVFKLRSRKAGIRPGKVLCPFKDRTLTILDSERTAVSVMTMKEKRSRRRKRGWMVMWMNKERGGNK